MSDASSGFDRERLEELLLNRALYGLPSEEQAELESLAASAGLPLDESFDLAVAALDAGFSVAEEHAMSRQDLPPSLRQQILDDASSHIVDRSESSEPVHPSQAGIRAAREIPSPARALTNSAQSGRPTPSPSGICAARRPYDFFFPATLLR